MLGSNFQLLPSPQVIIPQNCMSNPSRMCWYCTTATIMSYFTAAFKRRRWFRVPVCPSDKHVLRLSSIERSWCTASWRYRAECLQNFKRVLALPDLSQILPCFLYFKRPLWARYLPAVDVLVQVNGVLTSDNVVDGRTLGTLGFLGHF